MDKLWKLLNACRHETRRTEDKTEKAAWYLVLKPYDYRDVRTAVVGHFRQSKYFPSVGEITTRLPPLETPRADAACSPRTRRNIRWVLAYGRKRRELEAQARREGRPFDLHAASVAAYDHANAQCGMTPQTAALPPRASEERRQPC